MKKTAVILAFLLAFASGYAQDLSQSKEKSSEPEFKTVFGKKKHEGKLPVGYFFEFNAAYSMFGSTSVFLPGVSTGVILNHNWSIGLSGSLLGNPHGIKYDSIYLDTVGKPKKPAYMRGGYGGILIEYTLMPKSAVHFSFPLLIGMGYFCMRAQDKMMNQHDYQYDYNYDNYTVADNYCFVIEPGIRAEFNLVKVLRMGITLSYRYSPNFDLYGTSSSTINQFNAKLAFRLGKF
jgi:hypothetical protein